MSKPGIVTWVEENVGITECSFYETMYYGALASAYASAFSGQIWATAGLGAVAVAAQTSAEYAGCFYSDPQPPAGGGGSGPNGECWKVSTAGPLEYFTTYNPVDPGTGRWAPMGYDVVEILGYETDNSCVTLQGENQTAVTFLISPDAQPSRVPCVNHGTTNARYRINSPECNQDPDEPYKPKDPVADPYTHTDDEGCEWTFNRSDSYLDDQGRLHWYTEIVANNPECGGPFGYWTHPDGGVEWVTPTPPTEDPDNPGEPGEPIPPLPPHDTPSNCPDPCPDVTFPETPRLPAATYQLSGVCEVVAEGQPQPVQTWSIDEADAFTGLARRIDTLQLMLQKHLELKTPACVDRTRTVYEGDHVTINWVSLEDSPNSGLRLRKRTRYRTKSGRSSTELQQFYKDFTWDAGDVCVRHGEAWWGAPTVWASSEDEGKRVIRHLAGEAGIDPDQVGRWSVSGSNSPRLGVSGSMRIRYIDGIPWVSRRNGSNMLPM